MRKVWIVAGAAALLAGCSGEAPKTEAEEVPATLPPGQYEASWTVASLRSVDKTTPATNLKEKATGTATGCVADDGKVDPAMFAEDGDECTASNAYVRSGRISVDVSCRRTGSSGGDVRQTISGSYTAQGFEAEASTTTYLSGTGDYALVRTFTGKRIGECPPASEAANAAEGAAEGDGGQ